MTMIGRRLALVGFLLVLLQGSPLLAQEVQQEGESILQDVQQEGESILLAQEVQQEGESVCDCTDQCTKMTEARVVAVEKDWQRQMQALEESSRKDREALEATHREALETALQDVKEAQTSLERANSLRMEHEQALSQLQTQLEHDKRSCQASHDTVKSLQAEVYKLTSEKNQLKQNVKLFMQGKQRLQQSTKELTQDMDEFKKKLGVLTNRYLESSRDLLRANERLREFDNERVRINMKLILTDAQTFFQVAGLVRFIKVVEEWTLPFCEFVTRVLSGIWSDNAAWIDDLNAVKEWHKLNVHPMLEKSVYPILRNLVELREKALEGLADSIQYQSGSVLSYVRSLKGESKSRMTLLRTLEYSKSHSDEVARILERALCIFAVFWTAVGLFAWRRHRSKRLPGAKVRKSPTNLKVKVE